MPTALIAWCLGTAGCSHAVVVRPAPSYDAFTFETPLPASAAVFVDADQLLREVHVVPHPSGDGEHCIGSRYPVDAREALEVSVLSTLERLVRRVEPVSAPPDGETMQARGLDSVIVVRVDTFHAGLASGALQTFQAGVELTLSVSAFTRDGLKLREVVLGNGTRHRSGDLCDTGAEVLGHTVEAAIEDAMTELGEVVANSHELRGSLAAREFR
ncbi:MAG: hypothetical protein OXU35_05260 [Acidobacteriota bacterium]|nr:hypothetical protein [Acidobacteriota bacterium]